MRSICLGNGQAAAVIAVCIYALLPLSQPAAGQTKKKAKAPAALTFPPQLPDGKEVLTVRSEDFLKAPATIGKEVAIAKTPPLVDFLYYPCQTYPGKIWSNWGDGLAVGGKYYSSLGDHDAPQGNAFVYEFDPAKKVLRLLVDLVTLLRQMMGYYSPGKIHGRLDLGQDGWLYFSTHRGSAKATTDAFHYQGDWILRCDPKSGKSEVVVHGPVPKHCIPCSVLDPERMIFYGGTAAGSGSEEEGVQFFAYDLKNRKLLYSGPHGPPRYMIFAKSTGKIYYVPGKEDMVGPMMRYDPAKGGAPEKIQATLGLRAASRETPQGFVYTVSKGVKGVPSNLYSFNTKTEEVLNLGPAAVGSATYITSLSADPSGRYLYYVPGAHGGGEKDGSPVVQFDVKTRRKKVIAFLHPYFKDKIGATLVGTFSTVVDPKGDKLYITWNVNRGSRAWDCCALTVIHIPESERPAAAGQSAAGQPPAYPFVFRDVGEELGIYPHVAGIRGHAAAWGDVAGTGWPDLFVGTFHNGGSKPAMLLRNSKGKFSLDSQENLRTSGLGSGALFVDLANRGRLDLYVSNCAHGKEGVLAAPSLLFRNEGGGKFTDISKSSGACPPHYGGRGLAALDFDGDGLLDLVTCEQYYSSKVKTGPALYHNKGNFRFEDVAGAAGLPVGMGGLGVAVADVNNDGWPDIFLTHGSGEHRLLLNDGKGGFREAPGTREVFRWPLAKDADVPAGVCIADVNRDGLPDIVIGHHFKSPWQTPTSLRLYLNRGVKNGVPTFEDVTLAAGLKPLAMKAPHVEIQDFDNDGWPDIYTSIVLFKDGTPYPVIYKNLGVKDGIPRFREDAWALTDFPTAEDKAIKRVGPLFDKILKEKKIIYMAAGPSADFDLDGKLDLFLANWWIESRSLLLRNETPGGNWLAVQVEGQGSVNRMGLGARVFVYPAGKLGEANFLLGMREIGIGYGYCSGQEAVAHFGLGKEERVDINVILPHGQGRVVRKDLPANQRLAIKSR